MKLSSPSLFSESIRHQFFPALVVWAVFLLALLWATTAAATRQTLGPDLDRAAIAANNRGFALMGQFNYEAARQVFSSLVETHPDILEFRVNLAIATLNRQRRDDEMQALEILGRVLEQAPDQLAARYLSGLLELHMGRTDKAREHLQMVTASDPEDMAAAYFLGQCFMQLSRYETAVKWFNRALEGDPYLRSGYYGAFTAYQRLGRRQEARAMLERFKSLKNHPRAYLVEFKYRRMGAKAEVTNLAVPPSAPAAKPDGPLFGPPRPLVPHMVPVEWTRPETSEFAPSSMTAADMDNDGDTDLFIAGALAMGQESGNAVLLADSNSSGFKLDTQHPLARIDRVNAPLWGDMDNDGLTDVYLCRRGFNQLWRQKEKGGWEDITAATTTGGAKLDTVDGGLFDADHDGDLDLFLINGDGPNELLNNNRNGTFRPLAAESGLTGNGRPSRSLLVTDLDQDRDADLIVINARPPHEVYLNDLFWEYRPAPGWEDFCTSEVQGAVAGDLDADGKTEIYGLDGEGNLRRWSLSQDSTWRGTVLTPGPPFGRRPSRENGRLALADLDGDGRQEVVMAGADGWWLATPVEHNLEAPVTLPYSPLNPSPAWTLISSEKGPRLAAWSPGKSPYEWPSGPGRYQFSLMSLSGMEDEGAEMRSNGSGIGARLIARVDSRCTVVDWFRNDSGPGQSLQPVAVGLGGADQIDFVAIHWPDGVYQTEMDLKGGRFYRLSETQRQLSSCPVLFAWNGEGYGFVSDLLGVGGMGYALAPGEYGRPRPRESLMLPSESLQPREGRLLLKLTEPMEEVVYLDEVRLKSYDLPPGWAMTLDERMGTSDPEPSGQPVFYRQVILPETVVNDRGLTVTAQVRSNDLHPADPGALDRRFIGRLIRDHVLTLTFPRVLDETSGPVILVADGWVEYPYSQTNFAAWQAGAEFNPPTIEACGTDGEWQPVLEKFGYPAGMPRQMSVPLPELPPGTRMLRISTNQEIYWDRLSVAFAEDCPEMVRQACPLTAARLERIGFPKRTTGVHRLPFYDYTHRLPLWDVRWLEGSYTRLGPVEKLLDGSDNAVVIFGPGESVHLEFRQPPQSPPGWTRVYVLETNGWCKDRDLYTKDGDTVEPLPHLGEPSPAAVRLNQAHNTRYQSGPQ